MIAVHFSEKKISIIIIGLNEEEHLRASIDSALDSMVDGFEVEVLYVDSGSTDSSLEIAHSFNDIKVFELRDPNPTAAKGRNLGLHHATGGLVQFLDGDSVLQKGWLPESISVLAKNQDVAAVFGHCIETSPSQSVYMRACQYDWLVPTGEHRLCGGNALWRKQALDQAGLFNPDLPVGEEPELCYRVRKFNWRILCLDIPMVKHDLAMRTFNSYWARAIRSGVGYAFLGMKFRREEEKLWFREMTRNFIEPLLWLTILIAGVLQGSSYTLAILGIMILLRIVRVAYNMNGQASCTYDAVLYGIHTQFSKIPLALGQILGLWKYWLHKP